MQTRKKTLPTETVLTIHPTSPMWLLTVKIIFVYWEVQSERCKRDNDGRA